jgi:hypothetical protein
MLSTWESELRSVVQKTDAPFLGLLEDAFSPEVRDGISKAIAANPGIEGCIWLLHWYPTLFAIHLTSSVMSGMGQTGNYDLYRHICTALRLRSEPTPDEKEALWAAFRRSVTKLGLEVSSRTSGHHYMADTYLRQVGVPLAFADDLAEKMLVFARMAGLPDADDPDGIARWQSALESRLGPPFSRVAQKAVTFDTQGFYTRCFIRVYEYDGVNPGAIPLEKAMARAFEKLPSGSRLRRAALPFLMLNYGSLGVFVPAGEPGRIIEVTVDNRSQPFRVGTADEFLSIPDPLPLEVTLRDSSSQQSVRCEVWGDDKSNRLLIFTEQGRFKGRAQLGATEPLVLPPGRYTALSRFCPSDVDAEQITDEPRQYLFSVFLHPGQQQVFSNGPATLTLQGEGRLLALWKGPSRGTKDAVEFNHGALSLELEFPLEWLEADMTTFDVVLSSNTGDAPTLLPITVDASGLAELDVSGTSWHQSLPPGLSRLLAEIRRTGEARSLMRTSVLFWSGLESVSDGLKFRLKRHPANLISALCEHFSIAETLIQPGDKVSRHLSLSFQLDKRRVQTLVWNAPGVFVEVTRVNEAGARVATKRTLGSTEVVSLTSSNQIVVSSSESGELALGEWVQMTDFSRQASKPLAASFLASRITARSQTLTFKPLGTSVAVPLLRLVQPHSVHNISDKVSDGQLVIKLESPTEIEAILVKAREVLTGQNIEVELQANDSNWTNCRLGRARLMTLPGDEGGYVSSVYISLELWTAGAWTFKFDGRIANLWGHLQNQRLDQFAVGLVCDESGAQGSSATLTASLKALTDKGSLAVFRRVNAELLPCYAEASWTSIRWLSKAWRELVDKWRGHEAEGIADFIAMACARTAEDAAPSWMPQQHIGADLTGVFTLPADEYRKVHEDRHPLARALRSMAQVGKEYPKVFGSLLHAGAAMGFSNFGAVMRGATPRNFNPENYVQALRQTDASQADLTRLEDAAFIPEAGDYLGPAHYRYAHGRLEAGYERTLGGNSIRRGQAIGLCRHVRKVMPTLNGSLLKRLKGARPHIALWSQPDEESLAPDEAQRNENLANIQHFLSLLALYCRATARSPEHLPAFIATLKASEVPVEGCIAYLLQVGDAFFAYYLLLWEVVLMGEQNS